jgi:enoyl-CoA hydratase/carnithine racemase
VTYDGYSVIRVSVDGGVARVIIDNPPINLFDLALYADMVRVSHELSADPDVRVVVLSSAVQGFFIAHFDVSLIIQMPHDMPVPKSLHDFDIMCENFRTMPKATIAVIEGRAGGGGSELALACDMRFALRGRAVFNQPEVALGIVPGAGGTVRLPRLVGRSRALEAILGSDDIDAETAERWGWVNRTLDHDELWPFVDRLASRIAKFPAAAVAAAKESVLRADGDFIPDLLRESGAFNRLLANAESREAMQNFLARGGQTVEGESRLGDLAAEL